MARIAAVLRPGPSSKVSAAVLPPPGAADSSPGGGTGHEGARGRPGRAPRGGATGPPPLPAARVAEGLAVARRTVAAWLTRPQPQAAPATKARDRTQARAE